MREDLMTMPAAALGYVLARQGIIAGQAGIVH